MHEYALVGELVGTVERQAGGRPVTLVRVRHASTIPDDVLRQAWSMLTGDGPLAGAVLDPEAFDIRISCGCGYAGPVVHDDVLGGGMASCPVCGAIVTYPRTAELELLEVRTGP